MKARLLDYAIEFAESELCGLLCKEIERRGLREHRALRDLKSNDREFRYAQGYLDAMEHATMVMKGAEEIAKRNKGSDDD